MLHSPLLLLLLLLLLFLPPCLPCETVSFTECQQAPFVPGHNLAGEGFNVVKMEASGASVVDVKTYMVGGNQGNCTVCNNRLLKQKQKLPASVKDWRIKVLCKRSLSSRMYESSQSVMRETSKSLDVSWKVGLSIGGMFGFAVGGSHSKSSRFASSHTKQDKFSFTSHEFKCKYYTFRLHSTPPLSTEFEEALKNLPSTYDHKNTTAYRQFITIYGTHFIRRVHLGGRVHATTAIQTCRAAMSRLSMHTVKNCLSVEASATIHGITPSASTSFCKSQAKKLKTGNSFSGAFSDRVTEVLGGDGDVGDLLFDSNNKVGYKKWLKSLKTVPGVVSYQLSPLHNLVRENPTLRSSLKDAVSDYIRHLMVDSNCCPSASGVARMNVTVVRAAGLWGDHFSKTDGYVKVFYGNQGATTPVIWNNDFPRWNYRVHFGTVNLQTRTYVRFEVWDRDDRWNDDLLGKVNLIPTSGRNIAKTFKLKHGSLFVSLTVVCGPSLKGSLCGHYSPSPGMVEDGWGSGMPALRWDTGRAHNTVSL